MINKPLEEITLEDIIYLIKNAIEESKTLEYKSELKIEKDSDRIKFLAHISSFANTIGGDLIFGIKEKGGIPDKIIGIKIENIDEIKIKLENIIQNGIEPRVRAAVHFIPIENNNKILIIRVNKSWIGPHMVKNNGRFYSRHSAGRYTMDIMELRTAFNLSETLIERIRNFRNQRIIEIEEEKNTPVIFIEGAKIILHLIPLTSFSPAIKYNIDYIVNEPGKLPPIYSSGWYNKYTFEGFLTYDHEKTGGKITYSYAHFYRNGIIEAVEGRLLNTNREKPYLPSIVFEESLFKPLSEYLKLLKELKVDLPVYLTLTITGIKNHVIVDGNQIVGEKINKEILKLPETIIENYDVNKQYLENILRPLYDMIWNSCGLERSFNFDENGRWTASRLKI